MAKQKWAKAYTGPFTKTRASELVQSLKTKSVNAKVKIQARSVMKNEYDVYIKMIDESYPQ